MSIADDENLAMTLYKLYYEALGKQFWDFAELLPEERTAWVMVAQFVLSSYVVRDDNTPDHK